MQGPSGVDEILMEINDARFAQNGGEGRDHDDPSRLFEIFSNSGGETDVDGDDDGMSTASHLSSDGDGIAKASRRSRRGSGQRRRTLTLD